MKTDARIAGILYILLGVIAPVRLIYIPNAVFVSGNAQATAANIASHEAIFRMAILTDVMAGVLTLLVTMMLFRLFRRVDRDLASVMLILGGFMVTPIYFFNLVNDAAAVVIAHAPNYLAAFDQQQREGLVSLFLRLHAYGVVVNEMFWGLWLLPLGGLILKSRLLPRFIAIWLFANGGAYVLLSVLGILSPSLEAKASGLIFPALLGEVVAMFWLVFGRLRLDSPRLAEQH
jgi:uncharacterized membrane protein